jgi:hypothetical protein
MIWIIAKNQQPNNLFLLCIHVELTALTPINTTPGKPPLKL